MPARVLFEMPPELSAGSPANHDPGDEDPGEGEARKRIRAERQWWKMLTFPGRIMSMGMGARPVLR